MRVKVDNVTAGVVIEDDVFSLTSRPIVRRDTVLTEQHIQVLDAFRIHEVTIKEQTFQKDQENDSKTAAIKQMTEKEKGFESLYRSAVATYKTMFGNWQAGAAVDIYKMRNIIVPLIERMLDHPRHLFSLHHYSNVQDYIFHHAVSVGIISSLIAKRLSFSKGDIIQVGLAGALIDCGMSKVQPRILLKKTSLTPMEFDEIKEHPTLGYKMLKNTTGIKEGVMLSALQHHEREDGSGYPLGTKAAQIHTYSRIVAIADVFHAMTSERLYRGKQSPFKVLEQMVKDQFGKFDPKALSMLVNEFTNLSIGTKVYLTNGKSGEIVFVEPQSPTRPMIKLDSTGEILVLKQHHDLYIESIR